MLKNYFRIAWRNLARNKAHSFINIAGLSVGMTVAMLIGLWIQDELSFDHYFPHHSRLAQVMTTQTFNGETNTTPYIALPMAGELHSKHADDFKSVAQASFSGTHLLAIGDKKLSQPGMWVQPAFPSMLGLRMVKGSLDALQDPSSLLLAQSTAKALFGEADPLGKTIRVDNDKDMKIAGVYEDMPRNTSFSDTKLLLPWDKLLALNEWMRDNMTNWKDHSFQLFVQLNDQADVERTTAKIKGIPGEHFKDGKEETLLHPMDRWHLYSDFKNGRSVGGRIQFVWLFGIIGIFVLLLACINFMNLSTARSEKRAKEVGIRKAIGSLRRQLIWQFLSESLLVTLFAFVLALMLASVLLPSFNGLTGKDVSLPMANPLFWVWNLIFILFTGLVAGSYPAFYLSGFNPTKALKGVFRVGHFASMPRKVLVVVQFTVSITLIIGNRPVGYTRQGLITVGINSSDIYGHYNALRSDLLQTDALTDMAESSSPATAIQNKWTGFDWKGKDPGTVPLLGAIAVTHDFGKTIDWQIKEGRDFSRNFPTDTGALILNEAAVKLTGLKHPVGEFIKWNGTDNHLIIGVVKDMVMESPYIPVEPTLFFLDYGRTNYITMRIKPNLTTKEALAKIAPVFKRYNPGSPFEYQFTDEEYARKFSDEQRIGELASFFAAFAIFISCLGLFGLASFVAEQRTKEIGVRKILGASVVNLWALISKEFVTLILLSYLIAIPLAWHFLDQRLQHYEYRTNISWWIFGLAGIGAMLITLLTVSYQAIKAAIANPVKSLRT